MIKQFKYVYPFMTQTVLTMCVIHTLLCLEYIGTKLGTIYSQMNPNKLPKITGSVPPPKTTDFAAASANDSENLSHLIQIF